MKLKERFKNPIFWINVAISIIVPILAYYGTQASDITSWGAMFDIIKKAISNPYIVFTSIAMLWNTFIDPTTKGIKDEK